MWSRLKPRSLYDVFAGVALFVALSTGGAYAANTIGSADIIDGEVKAVDIGVGQVLGSRITDGTVKTEDIADNRVKGVDVDESTLREIGTASIADGAITRSKRALPEPWRYIGDPGEPAFENGWHNYDPASFHTGATFQHAAYRVDDDRIVHLGGLISGGTVGQAAFRLPSAYCPYYYQVIPILSANAVGRVTVSYSSGGSCTVDVNPGSSTWASLTGVRYPVASIDVRVQGGQAGATARSARRR